MKTAVSLPDELFAAAERLAKRLNVSRSELYSKAIGRYVSEHDTNELIRRANMVCDNIDTSLPPAFRKSMRNVLKPEDW